MTHSGTYLSEYLSKTKMRQNELARRMGLTTSHISRIINGRRVQIEPTTLARALRGLPAQERGAFLRAYLRDQLPEEFSGFVKEAVSLSIVQEDTPAITTPRTRLAALIEKYPAKDDLAAILCKLVENASQNEDFLDSLKMLSRLTFDTNKRNRRKN